MLLRPVDRPSSHKSARPSSEDSSCIAHYCVQWINEQYKRALGPATGRSCIWDSLRKKQQDPEVVAHFFTATDMVPTVSGLLQAINHDYTIWIVGATLLVFGLYWVSAKYYTLERLLD